MVSDDGGVDRPIIFSAPMVRALLAGRKTQTRRLLKPQPETFLVDGAECEVAAIHLDGNRLPRIAVGRCITLQEVRYAAGDRLYVREAHYLTDDGDYERAVYASDAEAVRTHMEALERLPAGFPEATLAAHRRLRPSIHMPRWASRLTLHVEAVKVERLQDISEADAIAEGIEQVGRYGGEPLWKNYSDGPTGAFVCPIKSYRLLWQLLHGPTSWGENPFVIALTFRVERGNIDRLPEGDNPNA